MMCNSSNQLKILSVSFVAPNQRVLYHFAVIAFALAI